MNNFFICKVTYEKMMENGSMKKVTEQYLVDAMSFTEAESRLTREVKPYISGDFAITDIRHARFHEVFSAEDADRFYRIRILFIVLDEKSGREKNVPASILVGAPSPEAAISSLKEKMEDSLSDYTIVSVSETRILDMFLYGGKEETV
jgi:hypothetical protein